MRALNLSFTFDLEVDGKPDHHEVSNRPGDAIRLRELLGGGANLDEQIAAGGMAAYDILYRFAWLALAHVEEFRGMTWDDFLDRCTAWSMVEDPARPTDAGPSNAP